MRVSGDDVRVMFPAPIPLFKRDPTSNDTIRYDHLDLFIYL